VLQSVLQCVQQCVAVCCSVCSRFYGLADCAASGPLKKIYWRALDDILELNSDKLMNSGIVRMFVLANF